MYLDIRLLKKVGTGAETVISYPNQHVTINLVVPDEIISKDADIEKVYSIARVHDGKADMLKADFDKGTNIITFETDRFSTYAIVYGDAKYNAATAVETGDGFHAELYGLILAISAILLLTATLFRKKTSNS